MKNKIEMLFETYPLENLELMCSEVWPIVSDYLIDEIDNNASLLIDSINAKSLTKCVEYICSEDNAARFRNGRSVFSVLIRLHQTEKINTSELLQAFIDNSELLEWWLGVLILHSEKHDLENTSLLKFVSSFAAELRVNASATNQMKLNLDPGNTLLRDDHPEGSAIEAIKDQLFKCTEAEVTENIDSILEIIPKVFQTYPMDRIGEMFDVIGEIESISPIAADIVWTQLKPKTPSPGATKLNEIYDRNAAMQGLDFNEGNHYVVKLEISHETLRVIVALLTKMPQSVLVTRLLDEFRPNLIPRQSKLTLDLDGTELFALVSVLQMVIYFVPNDKQLISEIEKLLFEDIRNAKKL